MCNTGINTPVLDCKLFVLYTKSMARLVTVLLFLSSVVIASAGYTDTLLFEVGGLWIQATKDLLQSMKSVLLYITDTSSVYVWLWIAGVPVILYYSYRIFWAPLNRVHGFGTLGYVPEGGRSIKDTANEVRKRRQAGNPPPIYPNGWFAVMESRLLATGEVKSVHCLGKWHLIVS